MGNVAVPWKSLAPSYRASMGNVGNPSHPVHITSRPLPCVNSVWSGDSVASDHSIASSPSPSSALSAARQWLKSLLLSPSGVATAQAAIGVALYNLVLLRSPGRMLATGLVVQRVSDFDVVWQGVVTAGCTVTVWRPKAPQGFAACGDVVTAGLGLKPAPVLVVRADSVAPAGTLGRRLAADEGLSCVWLLSFHVLCVWFTSIVWSGWS